jgi:hypothetical protein
VGIKMYIQGFYENKRKYIYKNRAHTAKKWKEKIYKYKIYENISISNYVFNY